jgi:geranylgeranyl diphosphate synthase type II
MDKKNKFIQNYKKELLKVEKEISTLFLGKNPYDFYDICSYALQGGGKRLRCVLLIFVAHCFEKKAKTSHILKAGLACEVAHSFSLVHDDVMDKSKKRRGKESVYSRDGVNMAILCGDSLIIYSYSLLIQSCSQENLKDILTYFTKSAISIAEGQAYDIIFEKKTIVSLSEYEEMIYKKTALSFETACFIAARLSGASKKEIEAVSLFGEKIGMAYQIQDDLLDICDNSQITGKPLFLDIKQKKKTYLFLKALEKTKKHSDHKFLIDLFSSEKTPSKKDITRVKDIYLIWNVKTDAHKKIQSLLSEARESLRAIKDSPSKNNLLYFIDSLEVRKK